MGLLPELNLQNWSSAYLVVSRKLDAPAVAVILVGGEGVMEEASCH